ncbi:ion channel [Rhodopseudomonas palustris]|uniref:K+ channel, inward rectifier n=1 Tax=Rhodopseudomonas palustris (strain BisB18) TaxID=316056 RepID=Q216L9_RHOPB
MTKRPQPTTTKRRIVHFGGHEIVTEGLELGFWADISHRCMTASWPSFIAGAAAVFLIFNAVFALFYWIGDQPIANVPGGAYIDFFYFSIETLSTAGYGDMHPQTHYGHFVATVELFTGIFSMSLMTGLIFARFSRPNARVMFAKRLVVSTHDGQPTLMARFANERHNIVSHATAQISLFRTGISKEGHRYGHFTDLALTRGDSPVLALSWMLYHVIDAHSPLHGLGPDDLKAVNAHFVVLVSGYDETAAQTVRSRQTYFLDDVRFGEHYADIVSVSDNGRVRIDYSRFHDTEPDLDPRHPEPRS